MENFIRLLPAREIDTVKWNQRVESEAGGLIYSFTYYLNAVCERWAGFVVNDYEVIIALPYKIKCGIPYWYTPPFVQQLGFIGHADETTLHCILQKIIKKYRYGTLLFNFSNTALMSLDGLETNPNYLLDLKKNHPGISGGYSADLLQNIRKAARNNVDYSAAISVKKAIELFRQYHAHQSEHISEKDYHSFTVMCENELVSKGQCITRAILNNKKEILSVALLLKDKKRIYNLMNTTTAEGRSSESNHYLFDQIIQEFAEENLLLDFEGSAIPGVQLFYKNFGASCEPYFNYHFNHLPFPLSLLS